MLHGLVNPGPGLQPAGTAHAPRNDEAVCRRGTRAVSKALENMRLNGPTTEEIASRFGGRGAFRRAAGQNAM